MSRKAGRRGRKQQEQAEAGAAWNRVCFLSGSISRSGFGKCESEQSSSDAPPAALSRSDLWLSPPLADRQGLEYSLGIVSSTRAFGLAHERPGEDRDELDSAAPQSDHSHHSQGRHAHSQAHDCDCTTSKGRRCSRRRAHHPAVARLDRSAVSALQPPTRLLRSAVPFAPFPVGVG